MESNLTDSALLISSFVSNGITICGVVYKLAKQQKIATWLLVANGIAIVLIAFGLVLNVYDIRNRPVFFLGNLLLLMLNAGLFIYYYRRDARHLQAEANGIRVPFFDNYIEDGSINRNGKFSIAFIDDESKTRQRDRYILEDYQQRAILPDLQHIELMENFDLIICDVMNVGMGMGKEKKANSILNKIKEFYPYKYVIAISTDENCLHEVNEAVDKAICKNISSFETELEKAIVDGVEEMSLPQNYWKKIETKLKNNHIPEKRIQKYKEAYAIHLYRKHLINR